MTKKDVAAERTRWIFFLVLVCFFLSGLSSLIYQVLWTKMIVKIIGAAPFAVAVVLTIFMAGLGLGSFCAARIIDRVKAPARLVCIYGLLELAVGLYALIIPLLLKLFHPLYAVIYNRLYNHFLLYNFLTFIGCGIILSVPIICMGATLPVLCRFYVTRLAHLGTHAGRLYGLNTIGAAVGALLCGFWLINYLGLWNTLMLAVLINVFIGIVCLLAGYRIQTRPLTFDAPLSPEAGTAGYVGDFSGSSVSPFTVNSALLIFAVSGFCAMAYEVMWTRLLGLVVGPTTYSFTIVLVSFITGIALGSMVFGFLADKFKNILWLLLITQIGTALSALFVSHLLGNSQLFFAKLIFTFQDNFVVLSFLKALTLFAFLLLPTVLSGATFPLVGKICTRSIDSVGRSLGFAYVINTIGAVAGSFCAGFLILPLLGKENSLSLVVALQLFAVLIIAAGTLKNDSAKWRPVLLFSLTAFGLVLCLFFPVWNRYLIASGKYHRFDRIDMYLRTTGWFEIFYQPSWFQAEEKNELGELVFYGDGIGGFTTVFKSFNEFGNVKYAMANSGKFDASSRGDMPTQTLLAHFPMLFHPNPKNVMVLGLASGITAGETLCYPIDRLDVVDISQQVVEASHFFDHWNNNVLANPKTNLIIQDGRAHLYLTNHKYDVIISEPSNPWMAGMANLFTRDFFAQAREKLNSDGIFCQWIHAYQMNWDAFALVCRTFADVLPNNVLVLASFGERSGDYLLLGFKGESKLNFADAVKKLPYIGRSKNMTLSDPRLLYPLIISQNIQRIVGPGPLHTDNCPRLEFEAQRTMYRTDPAIAAKVNSNRSLDSEIKKITGQVVSDVNSQIELSQYLFSLYTYPFGLVDLEKATPAQKESYFKLVDDYCEKNPLNLSAFPPEPLMRRCRTVQIEALKHKINSLPNKFASYLYLAGLYEQAGMLDEAVAAAKNAVALKPDMYSGYVYLADMFVRQGKIEQAVDNYQRALRIMPRNFRIQNALGIVLAGQSGYDDAARHFTQAVRFNPDFTEARSNLGHALLELNKLDEAINQLLIAAKLNPDNPSPHNYLAQAFERNRQFDKAVIQYREAVRLKPDWAVPVNSLAWLLAVKKSSTFHNPEEAVSFAKKACSLTNNAEPAVLDTLAAAYAANGQFNDAVTIAQKALDLARSMRKNALADEIEKHLKLFKTGRPYFETSS